MKFSLRLFDEVINKTTDSGMTPQMRTYYDKELMRNAKPELIFTEYGQKKKIPANSGKTIEFRRVLPLAKALTPLTEGVTPDGHKLEYTSFTATLAQYGDYIKITDQIDMIAVDNNLLVATEELGSQAGRTLDTLCRDELATGTNVLFGDGTVNARHLLVGGDATVANNDYFNTTAVIKAVNMIKKQNGKPINGSYVCMCDANQIEDMMLYDSRWNEIVKYNPGQMGIGNFANGEVGTMNNCKYVVSNNGKVFHAANLTEDARSLTVKTAIASGSEDDEIAVTEAISSDEATAMAGRAVIIAGAKYKVVSATAGAAGSAKITIDKEIAVAKDAVIYPGEAGAAGRDVYAAFVVGKDAYGVVDLENGGLQFITKPLGAGDDPLNQRATAGWKAMTVTKILTENFLVRLETASSHHDDDYVDDFFNDVI